MKYAKIENNIITIISYEPVEGWEEVNDNVFAGMIKKPDGTFDNTDETKARQQEAINLLEEKENKKQSAKSKLEALGLTTDEIREAFGI